jgi:hypothetical protein
MPQYLLAPRISFRRKPQELQNTHCFGEGSRQGLMLGADMAQTLGVGAVAVGIAMQVKKIYGGSVAYFSYPIALSHRRNAYRRAVPGPGFSGRITKNRGTFPSGLQINPIPATSKLQL